MTLVTLTGCVGIPQSGPVNQGLSVNEVSGAGNIAYNPEGPEAGASQQDILRGFVASFTSATGGYAVAKQFLSSAFADKWDPRASVQVRTGAPKLLTIDATTIDYSFQTSAIVDKNGAYSESSLAATLQYSFVREKNQWRISAAPDGIVLAEATFQRIFTERPLYFLDSTNTHLVPDIRWFPSGTSMTRIVNAVLAGPPDWLKGAAFSRFPDGTALSDAGSVVTSDNGVARIDLTKEAAGASPRDRQLMKLQLFESLQLVPNVSSVSISVEGTPMQIDDNVDALQVDTKVDTQALVFRNNKFGFYANGAVTQLPGLSQRVSALNAQAATLSSDQDTVAVLGSGGVSVVRRGGAPSPPVDARPNLIAPSLDEAGYTWSVPYDNPNAIEVFDPSGGSHPVSGPLPSSGSQIVSLEVSREGARVVILLSSPSGPRLIVAAIVRDEKQTPVSIGTPILDLSLGDGEAIDATWVDQTTVATLVTSNQQSRVELYALGGNRTSLDVLPTADQIVGGNNGADGLRVLGDDQSIWVYRGSSWQRSNVTVSFIATQR